MIRRGWKSQQRGEDCRLLKGLGAMRGASGAVALKQAL